MASRIEDYALIGDTQTVALVGKDGSIDWLCVPRIDSGAVFASLLGTEDNGRWLLAPAGGLRRVERKYAGDTLVLETTFHTDTGVVRVVDCMPIRGQSVDIVRCVHGVSGRVPMRMDLRIRFDYGSVIPWVTHRDGRLHAIAGPNALVLTAPVDVEGAGAASVADFVVEEGDSLGFVLAWHQSHDRPPRTYNALNAVKRTSQWWRRWARQCNYQGIERDLVVRSMITLKALTYAPTGGIAAAATTSLPEWIGSVRNWDYRYCWLRDSVLTLFALQAGGYMQEALQWRDWLLRAAAGDPAKLQIMYGVQGERRLEERTIDWLPGYEGSAPVRVGNAASDQFQLDVYGEVLGSMALLRAGTQTSDESAHGADDDGWALELALLDFLEGAWHQPDDGIWEMRGGRQQFTHSKVMAWLAFHSAVRSAELFDLPGPVDRWRANRDHIHAQVCTEGYDPDRGTFTQAYGSKQLDAALLQLPTIGFLPATDERMVGTVTAIERDLLHDGFVLRYRTDHVEDGLPAGEGVFLACSFWLASAYAMQGRRREARALFERLAAIANDVGLFSEEYDPASQRHLGNFPQAFTHMAFIRTASTLSNM
ncbi:MAG: glycoside hydrolase family 15 protein [Acidimicrobiia bacterium]|nr:glycoside hydrolase family 15 protein [Acidimicrobiia bacterium]